MNSKKVLVPRNGVVLRVLVVARISGCQNQKELSLEDQEDHAKQEVRDRYDGPCEYTVIATRGKGERLDRPELAEVEQCIRSGLYDIVVMEDVGRLVRGTAAVELWGLAVDRGTRCIAPNDGCDTAEPTWEEDLISACKDHVSHCAHTSRRIKQKQMNRFKRSGGAIPLPTYGYIKPEGAKHFSDWRKDDIAAPRLKEGFAILKREKNWTAVADHFNRNHVPTGPYCRNTRWDGAMARRLYHNPILKGKPQRGARTSDKNHETGRRISIVNREGPTYRDEPHLAHFDADELDAVLADVDEKNRALGRGHHPNNSAPIGHRRRSRFPGQCAVCWYCGRQMVWNGNGIPNRLMCNGAIHYQCWNSLSFDGPLLAQKLLEIITTELWNLDAFQDQFSELVRIAAEDQFHDQTELQTLESEEAVLEREKTHVRDSIRQNGSHCLLDEMLKELEERERTLVQKRRLWELKARQRPQMPTTGSELRRQFEEASRELAADSWEFGSLLRSFVSECHVFIVRSVDGGNFLPRAKVKLSLGGIVPGIEKTPDFQEFLTRERVVDLFTPPTRFVIREEAARLSAAKVKQRIIAASLKTHQATVQRALKIDRLLRERDLTDPYQMVTAPPDANEFRKLKRSRNERYRFEPRAGYDPPTL